MLRTTEPEMEAASSTTPTEGPSRLPIDPAEWTVEDVIQHINCVDIQLNIFADLFRKHVSFLQIFMFFKIISYNTRFYNFRKLMGKHYYY